MEKDFSQAKMSQALDECFMDTIKSCGDSEMEVSEVINGILSFAVHRLAHTIFLYKPKEMSCEEVIEVLLPDFKEALMFRVEKYKNDSK